MATLIEYYNNNNTFITFDDNKDIMYNIMDYISNKLIDYKYTNIMNKNVNDIVFNGLYLIINNNMVTFVDKGDIINIIYKWELTNNVNSIELYPKCNNITKNAKIHIIGKRGSGKSVLLKNILDDFDDEFIANSVIFCYGEHGNRYADIKCVYEFSDKMVNDYVNDGKNGAIVFDDVIRMPDTIAKYMHSTKMIILVSQFAQRNKFEHLFNYNFYSWDDFLINQKKIHHILKLNNEIPLDEFRKLFKQMTKDYRFMVNNNNIISYYKPIFLLE